jgi:hypothetical protein
VGPLLLLEGTGKDIEVPLLLLRQQRGHHDTLGRGGAAARGVWAGRSGRRGRLRPGRSRRERDAQTDGDRLIALNVRN